MSKAQSGTPPDRRFSSEAELVVQAREWLLDLVSGDEGHWLVVDEHLVGAKIPDLISARVDLRSLRSRIRSAQWQPLTGGELRVLELLRPDRSMRLSTIATHMGHTNEGTRRVIRHLEALGYVERVAGGGFVRTRNRYRMFTRLVAVEAKLRDWRRALVQARSHRTFAQECYVVFDAAYRSRFEPARAHFEASGTGLISLSPGGQPTRLVRARSSRRVDPNAFALAGEELWLRLQGVTRPLPQTRLPNAAARIAHRGAPGSPESRSKRLSRLLDDLGVREASHLCS